MQRLSPKFRSEEYFMYDIHLSKELLFYPSLQRFVWRCHVGAHGRPKSTETPVAEFC